MQPRNEPTPEAIRKLTLILIAVLGIPLLAALLFTWKQWYPATITINWLLDDTGAFPLKKAVLINWGILGLAELVILFPIVLIVKGIRARKAKNTP